MLLAALALAFVAVPLWSDTVDKRLDGFDPWVESIMQEWKVPGLGVAIIIWPNIIAYAIGGAMVLAGLAFLAAAIGARSGQSTQRWDHEQGEVTVVVETDEVKDD